VDKLIAELAEQDFNTWRAASAGRYVDEGNCANAVSTGLLEHRFMEGTCWKFFLCRAKLSRMMQQTEGQRHQAARELYLGTSSHFLVPILVGATY
jgi:hypothetical protein